MQHSLLLTKYSGNVIIFKQLFRFRSGPTFCPARSGPEIIKLFSCSTQLIIKFIMLINVKMPTIIYLFISMINTTSQVFVFQHFRCYDHLKFHAQLSWAWKSFITSRPGSKMFAKTFSGPMDDKSVCVCVGGGYLRFYTCFLEMKIQSVGIAGVSGFD